MARVTAEDLTSALARLASTGAPDAWLRAVRLGANAHGECVVQVATDTWVTLAYDASTPPVLTLEITTKDSDGKTQRRTLRAGSDGDTTPRRSVRLSDETWAELGQYGPPSTVLQDAAEEYLARRRKPG